MMGLKCLSLTRDSAIPKCKAICVYSKLIYLTFWTPALTVSFLKSRLSGILVLLFALSWLLKDTQESIRRRFPYLKSRRQIEFMALSFFTPAQHTKTSFSLLADAFWELQQSVRPFKNRSIWLTRQFVASNLKACSSEKISELKLLHGGGG